MENLKDKEHFRGGCPHCPDTEDVLALDTVLYNGFGGYTVFKDGECFYSGDSQGKWEDFKILSEIEEEIKKTICTGKEKWKVVLDNPLRGAIWERATDGQWILKETNQGFA